jgi:hypothetical protein
VISDGLTRIWQEKRLPILGTAVFLVLVAVAEYQVRTSSQWPPPARHEIGGWEIPDPPAWTLAGSLNLPATIAILSVAVKSDAFTYALDDHELIIYIPWTIFVWYLWRFVALHLELSSTGWIGTSPRRRLLFFLVQAFVTVELIYCALGLWGRSPSPHEKTPMVVFVFLWMWIAAALAGWANLLISIQQKIG